MRDAAAYVRRRVGLSQAAFAKRIGVPVDTVRNWEQGKHSPRGPARALLRIIDHAPELALAALVEDLGEPVQGFSGRASRSPKRGHRQEAIRNGFLASRPSMRS
jgi:transcriptional regulator with XRE-family HTH domain